MNDLEFKSTGRKDLLSHPTSLTSREAPGLEASFCPRSCKLLILLPLFQSKLTKATETGVVLWSRYCRAIGVVLQENESWTAEGRGSCPLAVFDDGGAGRLLCRERKGPRARRRTQVWRQPCGMRSRTPVTTTP